MKATLSFETESKGCNFTKTVEEGNGYYTSVFDAPKVTKQINVTVTVNATKTGYMSVLGSINLTVDLNSSAAK